MSTTTSRINRFAAVAAAGIREADLPDDPEGDGIMDPIGARDLALGPIRQLAVDINGAIGSVSGGTRWGGGMWINI